MKILRSRPTPCSAGKRRGAALLLSLLILLVLVAIVIQLNVSTGTDARMARNDVTLTAMDLAVESAMLQELETLKSDAESDSSGGASPTGGAAAQGGANQPAGSPTGAGAGGPAAQPAASDSRRDEWANPQRTEINEIKLRVVVVDEDSKYNVLNMLNPDPKEAEAAFDRVVRILDLCRDGTDFDIDQTTAEDMAKAMRDHMTKRKQSKLPRPALLTDQPKNEDLGMPLSMREFRPLVPFEDHHFKDFRDSNGVVVHSITSFLTVWTSLGSAPAASGANGTAAGTGNGGNTASNNAGKNTPTPGSQSTPDPNNQNQQTNGGNGSTSGNNNTSGGQNQTAGGSSGGGSGSTTTGYGVNVNTAPVAVLHGLCDSRDVPSRFWDKLVEWRNLEDEEEKEKEKQQATDNSSTPPEEQLDEYGQPMIKRQFFDTLQKLSDVDGFTDLPAEQQTKLNQLLTTQSNVFSIYIVARKSTAIETGADLGLTPAEQRKREETTGDTIVRVVHAVYWRHKAGQDVTLTPVVRWEVLDYLPYEVLDYPPDER